MNAIALSPQWQERVIIYGRACVQSYTDGKKEASRRLQRPDVAYIAGNSWAQAHSKMAEVVACLHYGIDPEELDWGTEQTDIGWDMMLGKYKVDVKATIVKSTCLIWPLNKSHFHSKADVFLLVRVTPNFDRGTPDGWIWTKEFYRRRHIASARHKLIEGTQYMEMAELTPCKASVIG